MSKIIMMTGLPASGKSTRAEEIMIESGNTVRLNKDLIRKMLHFGKFTGKNEGMTNDAEKNLVKYFINEGKNVIIDDTNMGERYLERWSSLSIQMGASFEVISITTPLEECIIRDKNRDETVGKEVIINMARRAGTQEAFAEKEIIVDLDGTLCNTDHRLHFVKNIREGIDECRLGNCDVAVIHTHKKDWKSFFSALDKDTLRNDVFKQVQEYVDDGAEIVLVSGRPDNYKKETITWLKKNNIKYKTLIMRRTTDKRDDDIVKQDILDNYFEKDRIVAVFDDRPRVIRMWKNNDLNVIDVGKGEEF